MALGAALAASVALLALPRATPESTEQTQPTSVGEVWPDAQRADFPVGLVDGPAYSPALFLDARTSVGTAPNPGGTHLRLVVRAADGALRELRRLPLTGTPQFSALAVTGSRLAWAESTSTEDGRTRTEMWTVDLAADRPAQRLTRDTGEVLFFNSQYDMVIHEDRLYWAAAPPEASPAAVTAGAEPVTEVRSVALTGGPVQVRREPGAWAMSAWPWLVTAGGGASGPIRLRNLDAREVVDVDAGAELVSCSPTWCRVLVLGDDGPSRIDLMRPDGRARRQIADGAATASVIDVAVLDRFEVLSLSDVQRTVTNTQQLLLYDLRRNQTVVVAEGVGTVFCRGGVLWWSTGNNETVAWHTLDLRTLS
ncbi:hypothetical protein ACWDV4_02450 [Micromonospora sp. NPDC003197]